MKQLKIITIWKTKQCIKNILFLILNLYFYYIFKKQKQMKWLRVHVDEVKLLSELFNQ